MKNENKDDQTKTKQSCSGSPLMGLVILPCPFCGGKAKLKQTSPRVSGHGESSDKVGIECEECHNSFLIDHYADYKVKEREEHALEKWNRRIENLTLKDIVRANNALKKAAYISCTCTGTQIRYEGGCECNRGKTIVDKERDLWEIIEAI